MKSLSRLPPSRILTPTISLVSRKTKMVNLPVSMSKMNPTLLQATTPTMCLW